MRGLTWQISPSGEVRFCTASGECPIWLDPEQAKLLLRDYANRYEEPEYVPQPHAGCCAQPMENAS